MAKSGSPKDTLATHQAPARACEVLARASARRSAVLRRATGAGIRPFRPSFHRVASRP
jgi:hypothetical protein